MLVLLLVPKSSTGRVFLDRVAVRKDCSRDDRRREKVLLDDSAVAATGCSGDLDAEGMAALRRWLEALWNGEREAGDDLATAVAMADHGGRARLGWRDQKEGPLAPCATRPATRQKSETPVLMMKT